MSVRLESSRLKAERARHHLREAATRIDAWRDGDPQGLRPFYLESHFDPDGQYCSVRFHLIRTPPTELSLVVDDCVSNARAALDHLAWQIVPEWYKKSATSRMLADILFPISHGTDHDWRRLVGAHMPKISTYQRAIVRSHQPFTAPEHNRRHHPLALLDRYATRDTRRVLPTTVVRLRSPITIKDLWLEGDFQPTRIEMCESGPGTIAREGVEVARVYGVPLVGQRRAHVGVAEGPSSVGFEDGHPLLDGLNDILCEVESVILEIETTLDAD